MAVESNSWATQKKFDVNSIRKKISGVAYLSKFYFRLVASINGAVDSKVKKILSEQKMQDLFIYANNVTVPQRAIDGENYTYPNGYKVSFPTTTSYGDGTIGINVRMDEKYKFYQTFIEWMDIIHSKKTGHLSFYDDYVCDIEIYQLPYTKGGFPTIDVSETVRSSTKNIENLNDFDSMLEKMDTQASGQNHSNVADYYKFRILNCYPKTISAIEFAHESQEKVSCLVNFAYEGIEYNPTMN